jgi:hypothetical protein
MKIKACETLKKKSFRKCIWIRVHSIAVFTHDVFCVYGQLPGIWPISLANFCTSSFTLDSSYCVSSFILLACWTSGYNLRPRWIHHPYVHQSSVPLTILIIWQKSIAKPERNASLQQCSKGLSVLLRILSSGIWLSVVWWIVTFRRNLLPPSSG